jgi:hypothetical protein
MSTNRTQPNPIDTRKFYAAKLGQPVSTKACSLDPARARHVARQRNARFARLLSNPERFASIRFFNS